jgi:CheY-like chemotaxis protein
MNPKSVRPPVDILIVEDDEVDVQMIRRAFKKRNIQHAVYHAETGVEALEMLRGENNRQKIPSPHVMLVDINLPLMNGIEMLGELRNDDNLRHSVAFILTTSARKEDKVAAYKLNVAGYFLKENLDHLIGTLDTYCQGNQFPE